MSIKQEILDDLFSGDRQLPTLPVLFGELNKLLDNPFASNKQISQLLMKDQSMVVKVLKLSNSALYSKRQEITSLSNAITFLGTQTLRNLILQISIVRLFVFEEKDIPEFDPNIFWEHSLGTAYFTEILVKKLNLPPSDNYYIGGLLHDLGKLCIYQFYPEKFKEIVLKQLREDLLEIPAEEIILCVNRAEIGEYLAIKWNFKPDIIAAIKSHHTFQETPAVHVAVIRIANMFAKAAGLCFPWDKHIIDIVGDPAWEILKNYASGEVDVERLTFEITDESEIIKESVKELLSKKAS
ncbi:MAG: HDOD domain-containing protein [bacterium]|nr:HDOD domain-containing protein [bacterium]